MRKIIHSMEKSGGPSEGGNIQPPVNLDPKRPPRGNKPQSLEKTGLQEATQREKSSTHWRNPDAKSRPGGIKPQSLERMGRWVNPQRVETSSHWRNQAAARALSCRSPNTGVTKPKPPHTSRIQSAANRAPSETKHSATFTLSSGAAMQRIGV